MDIGIQPPWEILKAGVLEAEVRLQDANQTSANQSAYNVNDLRTLHERYLDSICSRLFLLRDQAKFRDLIYTASDHLSRIALTLHRPDRIDQQILKSDIGNLDGCFRNFARLLYSLTQENVAHESGPDFRSSSLEAMRTLLLRLNWNKFYTEDGIKCESDNEE